MQFEFLWIISSIFFLSWAAYQDWKFRLIQDRIWLLQLIVSLILYIIWFTTDTSSHDKILSLINILMTILFAFAFFYFGAFGGADSKALMVLTINTPIAFSFSYIKNDLITPYPSIMFVLFNMILFFLLFAIFLSSLNLIQRKKYGPLFSETRGSLFQKFNVLISARRISRNKIAEIKFHDPVEVLEADYWKLYTPVFEGPLEDTEFDEKVKEMRENAIRDIGVTEKQYLWMRPQPPGILFILAAQIMWIFVGSPLTYLLQYYEVH